MRLLPSTWPLLALLGACEPARLRAGARADPSAGPVASAPGAEDQPTEDRAAVLDALPLSDAPSEAGVAARGDAGGRPDDSPPDDSPPPDGWAPPAANESFDAEIPPADAAPPDAAPEPPDAEPPDAAPPPRPLLVAVISDLNGGYGDPTYGAAVHAATRRIIAARPDLVLCAGDMVAGQRGGLDYRAMWRGFHAAVTDPLREAGIPLAVSPGNHDASAYGGFEEERRVYAEEWRARRPDLAYTEDADYPFRYAFTMGEALFVALDDTRVGPFSAAERRWVEDRIDEAPEAPVQVVFGHLPIRPFTVGREDEILDDDALEASLAQRGVDVFLSGHHHGYYPGRHGGLRQVSMACLGDGPRALVGTRDATPRALVFFRVAGGVITELEGYTGADLQTRVARSDLPPRVGVVTRDDL